MSTVDNPAIIRRISVGLSAKLEAKVFDYVYLMLATIVGSQSIMNYNEQAGGRAKD